LSALRDKLSADQVFFVANGNFGQHPMLMDVDSFNPSQCGNRLASCSTTQALEAGRTDRRFSGRKSQCAITRFRFFEMPAMGVKSLLKSSAQ
jgi:hypothetical protein